MTRITLAVAIALVGNVAVAGPFDIPPGLDKVGGSASAVTGPSTSTAVTGPSTAIAAPVQISNPAATAVSGAIAGSQSSSNSYAGSTSSAVQVQGQDTSVRTTLQSTNGGNAQNITFTTPANTDATIRNVPEVNSIIASPTAPCRVQMGAGVGIPGGGLSLGGSTLDEGCDTREDARMLHNMGLKAEAIKRLCAKPELALALAAKCGTTQKMTDGSGKVWTRESDTAEWKPATK